MRAVTAGLFHSVDGVVEAPNLWQFDSFDAELAEELGGVFTTTGTVLLGRIGYEQWSDHWVNVGADDPFGVFINPIEKFVASRTLTGALSWENATLIEGDVLEFVRDVKDTEGGDIAVMGGISLVRQLFLAGLMDTLTLITHPVIAGAGRHLFEPGDPITRMTLTGSRVTSTGNVITRYAMRES